MTTFLELLEEIENQQKSLQKLHEKVLKMVMDYESAETEHQKEKTYTWEESFQNKGFYLEATEIEQTTTTTLLATPSNYNVATTEKVVKSNLAACQLSHIIEAINKDFEEVEQISIYFDASNNNRDSLYTSKSNVWALPFLNSEASAICLLERHQKLLKQYFGVE